MEQQFILALDIGTSSVRASLYDLRGEAVPEMSVRHERSLDTTGDGGSEIDADEAVTQAVAAVDELLKKSSPIEGAITHVASCAFWHSLVGVDSTGRPTTKVLSWADTRSRGQVETLRKRFDESETHNRTGARFHSSFWPAKLLLIKKKSPEIFAKTARWLSFSDYLALKLFGRAVTSVSMASATGIFDIRRIGWDAEMLRYLKVKSESLPNIAGDGETCRLTPKFAKRWPRLKNAGWFPAIGDGAANNIGAGCVKKSTAALMVGTSGAMRVAYEGEPPAKLPPGLWCYRIDGRRVIVGGALSDGGGLYSWLKENLGLTARDDLIENEIAKRPPAAHGLTFLPFVAGERSTGYHEDASGAILGLKASHDRHDIIRAAFESVAYRFAEIFDQLNEIARIREIHASGGALRESPVWTQIIADVLGREINLPDTREASLRGAVLLALETLGVSGSIDQPDDPERKIIEFNPEHRGIYRIARAKHNELYRLLVK